VNEWKRFSPVDATSGLSKSGTVSWDILKIDDWMPFTTAGDFCVKIEQSSISAPKRVIGRIRCVHDMYPVMVDGQVLGASSIVTNNLRLKGRDLRHFECSLQRYSVDNMSGCFTFPQTATPKKYVLGTEDSMMLKSIKSCPSCEQLGTGVTVKSDGCYDIKYSVDVSIEADVSTLRAYLLIDGKTDSDSSSTLFQTSSMSNRVLSSGTVKSLNEGSTISVGIQTDGASTLRLVAYSLRVDRV
jgi:hypothetical protein